MASSRGGGVPSELAVALNFRDRSRLPGTGNETSPRLPVSFEMQGECVLLLSQSSIFAEPRTIDDESGAFFTRVEANLTNGQTYETAAIFGDHDISDLDAKD